MSVDMENEFVLIKKDLEEAYVNKLKLEFSWKS